MTPTKLEVEQNNKIDWLKYLNSFLLSVISIALIFLIVSVRNVKDNQVTMNEKLVLIYERQNVNTASIAELDKRVDDLEQAKAEAVKEWVTKNFVQKIELPSLIKQIK